MNHPSRTDPEINPNWNQNLNTLSGNLTTRSDFSRIADARHHRDHRLNDDGAANEAEMVELQRPGVNQTVAFAAGLEVVQGNVD